MQTCLFNTFNCTNRIFFYFNCNKHAEASYTNFKCSLIIHISELNASVPAKPGLRPGCLFFSYVFSMKEGIPDTVFPWSERRFPPLSAEWYTPRGIWFISCLTTAVRKVSRAALKHKFHELSRLNNTLKALSSNNDKPIIYSILFNLSSQCSLCCGRVMLHVLL